MGAGVATNPVAGALAVSGRAAAVGAVTPGHPAGKDPFLLVGSVLATGQAGHAAAQAAKGG